MTRQVFRTLCGSVILAAALALVASNVSAQWFSDLEVSVTPSTPTDTTPFDLRALEEFGDTGYDVLSQAMQITGNNIGVSVYMQDLHTNPNLVFAAVITSRGAFFPDVGPLAAGTYSVNAEMYMTPWPSVWGGELISTGSLTFDVADAGTPVVGPPGDYNDDGIVDVLDYCAWRNRLGTSASLSNDLTPGSITEDDFYVWREHFGETSGSGATAMSAGAVPEPATFILATLGLALACALRRQPGLFAG